MLTTVLPPGVGLGGQLREAGWASCLRCCACDLAMWAGEWTNGFAEWAGRLLRGNCRAAWPIVLLGNRQTEGSLECSGVPPRRSIHAAIPACRS